MDQDDDSNQKNKYRGAFRISSTDPKIITMKKYIHYNQQGRMASSDENQLALLSTERKRKSLAQESTMRKNEFYKLDMKRSYKSNHRLTEIQSEERKRSMHLLERAFNMKLEEEEEIQKCNRFILETKCRAVRDAQIAEKNIINRQLMKETQRINDMMEKESRLAMKVEAEKDEEEIMKRQKFAEILRNQILENREHQLTEMRRKQEESRLINYTKIAWQKDEILKLRSKEIENAKIRKSLSESNDQLIHFKDIEQEENRIMDIRVREYQQMKHERDDKIAVKQRLARLQKEQEKQRVALKVQNALELQARTEEVNAAKLQEEVEKEWRRKEKEEALQVSKNEIILKMSREEQIKEKRIMQALEIKRDEEQFDKIIVIQKQAVRRDAKEKHKKYKDALYHRSQILKQINEKEHKRILTRQKMFQEGLSMRKEAEIRKCKLREAMERKCDEMRKNKVPESYIREVGRMIENVK